jgi:hypothetical protein
VIWQWTPVVTLLFLKFAVSDVWRCSVLIGVSCVYTSASAYLYHVLGKKILIEGLPLYSENTRYYNRQLFHCGWYIEYRIPPPIHYLFSRGHQQGWKRYGYFSTVFETESV